MLLSRLTRRRAFTLVELLIVIAIIAVLAALLFPVFGTARSAARRAACIANLHQIGLALTMYRQDYEELPPRLSGLFPTYVSHADLFVCPNDPGRGRYAGTLRMEGANYLPGVSYDYTPNWDKAQVLGWWRPPPRYGGGQWEDLTPVADCQWHWAKEFNADWNADKRNAKGWQLLLMLSGSVRKLRSDFPMESFTPDMTR